MTSEPTPARLDIPAGFEPITRVSPVATLIGPVYSRGGGLQIEFGMRVQEKHCNLRGTVHGGIFATLADIALGYTLALSTDPPSGFVTANLSIDYAGSARVGDWLSTLTDVQRQGGRLAFANCYIYVGEQRIVRASGVFLSQPLPATALKASS
jgi:acyl-coenzyme A thioesterase 13